MLLFNVIRLTPRRVLLLLVASLVAATAAFTIAVSRSSTHSSTAIIFTSQLLRDNRTDGELQNLVDDLLLATELTAVTDAVELATGLEYDKDYTVLADRAIDDGDTIEITTTSQNRSDAETAAHSVGQTAFEFIVGQDVAQASAAQEAAHTAVAEITAELERLEAETGGISPVALHDQAQADLAILITARGTADAPTVEETQLLERVSTLATPRRQYLQLEAQLENHRDIELQELQSNYQSDVVLTSLGTDILIKNAEENSLLPLIIQTVLLTVLATVAVALALFAVADRREAAQAGTQPVGQTAQQPSVRNEGPASAKGAPARRTATGKPTKSAKANNKPNVKSKAKRRSVPPIASDDTSSGPSSTQTSRSNSSTSRMKANGSDRDNQNPTTRPGA